MSASGHSSGLIVLQLGEMTALLLGDESAPGERVGIARSGYATCHSVLGAAPHCARGVERRDEEGKRSATGRRAMAQDLMKGRHSAEVRMLDSFFMLGGGLGFLGLIALLDPILLGWRSRRDALYILMVAVGLIAAGWAARSI